MSGRIRVMVVGSGGREHALVWKIIQSPLVSKVYCAPGNHGIAQDPKVRCLSNLGADDLPGLRDFALANGIGLTVVGPEKPLAEGIVDVFEEAGLKIVGPTKQAARLESSKVFAKRFMACHEIPTADFAVFDRLGTAAVNHIQANLPCVIKADGLAGGKGVFICRSKEHILLLSNELCLKEGLVVEEFLEGEEATFMVLTDGSRVIPLLPTQDHKPVFDYDEGPITGGMGAYAPAPIITKTLERKIMEAIIMPTLEGMKEEGSPYKGILYAGLMIVRAPDGPEPRVLEFNCRFGDPELQPLLMLMESDIVPFLLSMADERLPEEKIKWLDGAAACVVMCSDRYPGTSRTGREIKGLDKVVCAKDEAVFHAATILEHGVWKTAGGRVLDPTIRAENLPLAINRVYDLVSQITWEGEHHRTDIALKALKSGVQAAMRF